MDGAEWDARGAADRQIRAHCNTTVHCFVEQAGERADGSC